MKYKKGDKDNIYYRDGAFFCYRKDYGSSLIIMSGGSKYVNDSMTTRRRSIIFRKELKNFTKINYENLEQYPFITKTFITKTYSAYYSNFFKNNTIGIFSPKHYIEYSTYDEEKFNQVLNSKYKKYLRKDKLNEIESRRQIIM